MLNILLAATVLLGQADATSEQQKLDVQRLVRRLNADQLADRDAAEEKLISLGEPVLDLLPTVNPRTPPEVKQRLEKIRRAVQRAAGKAFGQAAAVTLKADAMPLSQVLAEFTKQTGNAFTANPRAPEKPDDPPVTAQFDKTPFWQALDEVLDKTLRSVYLFGEEKGIQIAPRAPGELARVGRADYQGPFRFEPVRVEAQRELRYQGRQVLQLSVEVAWEPRLAPIVLMQPMDRITAVDDQGRPVPVLSAHANPEINVMPGEMAKVMVVPLSMPSRETKALASLKGHLRALVPGKTLAFRFDDLSKAVGPKGKEIELKQSGVTVVLEPIRQSDMAWDFRVRVRFDEAGEALQSHRNWILENEAYLEGTDGKPIAYDGMETVLERKDEVGLVYAFALEKPPTDLHFVYKTPGMILPVEIDYEVKDIPLP
jgi:hypothetical protein